jgi:hypothetical protein
MKEDRKGESKRRRSNGVCIVDDDIEIDYKIRGN